jgi:general nucleoside transport system ATP-binding protein
MAQSDPVTVDDPGTAPLVEMVDVRKRFGTVLANDDASLTLRHGEILGLLGENGAGKSTLMKILYGLLQPDGGSIHVGGKPVRHASPADAVRLGVGMVHQEFMLISAMTVWENVVLGSEPGSLAWLDGATARERVSSVAKQFGLRIDVDRVVGRLSVGERQRVEILKALYRQVKILILDEPTAVLTPQEVDDLFRVLREFVARGLSIVFITHKLREVVAVSDRITIMRDGRVVATVATSETNQQDLARLMVGRAIPRVERGVHPVGAPVLRATDVVYGSHLTRTVIPGLSLTVHQHEIVGIAGVDGNGQRELAELLAGMRRPEAGHILLGNIDITLYSAHQRHLAGLAHIPEDRRTVGLIQRMDLAENLILKRHGSRLFARRGFLDPRSIMRFAAAQVRAFDVRPSRVAARASSLSGGNQQKVILARELYGQPTVIIAAQPTRGLDVGAIEFVHRQLLAARDRGSGVLLISYELEEIRALADRIFVMYEGRIIGQGANEALSDQELGLWMAGISAEQPTGQIDA